MAQLFWDNTKTIFFVQIYPSLSHIIPGWMRMENRAEYMDIILEGALVGPLIC